MILYVVLILLYEWCRKKIWGENINGFSSNKIWGFFFYTKEPQQEKTTSIEISDMYREIEKLSDKLFNIPEKQFK